MSLNQSQKRYREEDCLGLDTYPEWRLIDYQPELFIAMLLENAAKEDQQKVDQKHQGRLRTTEYTI